MAPMIRRANSTMSLDRYLCAYVRDVIPIVYIKREPVLCLDVNSCCWRENQRGNRGRALFPCRVTGAWDALVTGRTRLAFVREHAERFPSIYGCIWHDEADVGISQWSA